MKSRPVSEGILTLLPFSGSLNRSTNTGANACADGCAFTSTGETAN